MTPQHRNEYQNLEEKLNEACANFKRHSTHDNVPGLVMLHLPTSAHIEGLTTWIRHYLKEGAADSLDAVFLYQPIVLRDSQFAKASLSIYLDELENPKCRITSDDRRTLFLMGNLLAARHRSSFGSDNIDDKYSYQSGNFFLDASSGEEFGLTFTNAAGHTAKAPFGVSTPAAGVHFHKVSVDAEGKEIVASPRVSSDDRLLIL
jgi:hypothetical protein